MSASSIANCKYPWAKSNEVNQTAAFTACKASSIWGKGNESHIVMAFKALKIYAQAYIPSFFYGQWQLAMCMGFAKARWYLASARCPGTCELQLVAELVSYNGASIWACLLLWELCVSSAVTKTKIFITQWKYALVVIDELNEPLCCNSVISTSPMLTGKGSQLNSFSKSKFGLLKSGWDPNFNLSPSSFVFSSIPGSAFVTLTAAISACTSVEGTGQNEIFILLPSWDIASW